MKLAPIVLFVYNRPWHTKQTIEALQKNILALESHLIIFSDGDNGSFENKEKVFAVREYLKTVDGFKSIKIIERDKNYGLAYNIINGVTDVVNQYGKVIVLEDDLVTSQFFLKFMNDALNFYENEKKVWHISGWNYPIDSSGLPDIFLWRVMNCWGWATWSDRWNYFEKNTNKLINEFDKKEIKKFNLDGVENFWKQIIDNKKKKIDTWAVYWYSTIFKKNGLCLNPTQTFVKNIGNDGSGTNCEKADIFNNKINMNEKINFELVNIEDKVVLEKIKLFFRSNNKSFIIRIINKKIF